MDSAPSGVQVAGHLLCADQSAASTGASIRLLQNRTEQNCQSCAQACSEQIEQNVALNFLTIFPPVTKQVKHINIVVILRNCILVVVYY